MMNRELTMPCFHPQIDDHIKMVNIMIVLGLMHIKLKPTFHSKQIQQNSALLYRTPQSSSSFRDLTFEACGCSLPCLPETESQSTQKEYQKATRFNEQLQCIKQVNIFSLESQRQTKQCHDKYQTPHQF